MYRRLLLLLLLMPAILFAQPSDDDKTWAELAFTEGRRFEQKTPPNWENAHVWYKKAVARDGGNIDYRFHAAYAAKKNSANSPMQTQCSNLSLSGSMR